MATRKTTPAAKTAAPVAAPMTAKKAPAPATKAPAKKPAAAPAPKAAAEPAKLKSKLIRDSFTIPKSEYAALDVLKQRAMKLTRPAKKGELLRAGIAALTAMSDPEFLAVLGKVPNLKTGRPKTAKASATKPAGKKA